MNRPLHIVAATAAVATLAACSNMMPMQPAVFSQAALPAAVQVPAGHVVALESVGAGDITYECREKAAMAGQYEWVFVGPSAPLVNRSGQTIGRYFGPPATWAAMDGSAITGAQVAVAPAGDGNIPLQLVKANPATGAGAMAGVSYIQRVATKGGTAPGMACNGDLKGRREIVKYRADYIFWKPV
jgi:DNA-binding transcriptional regulator YdaS (Cro superfamily)